MYIVVATEDNFHETVPKNGGGGGLLLWAKSHNDFILEVNAET